MGSRKKERKRRKRVKNEIVDSSDRKIHSS